MGHISVVDLNTFQAHPLDSILEVLCEPIEPNPAGDQHVPTN